MAYSFDQVRERAEIELVKKRKVCGFLHVCLCEWDTVGILFNNGILLCINAVPLYDWSDLKVACICVFTLNPVFSRFCFRSGPTLFPILFLFTVKGLNMAAATTYFMRLLIKRACCMCD